MAKQAFTIRIWGARGSMASSAAESIRYGGNTACVEVRCGEDILILDAGSGLRMLGDALMAEGNCPPINLFFSHCHYDHISGLPFFAPFFSPKSSISIWSGHMPGPQKTLRMVQEYMRPPFFPVGPEVFSAKVAYQDFEPGDHLSPTPNVKVETLALNHHDGCIGYRIDFDGRAVCYITDTTHIPDQTDQEIVEFITDADLMIYDATYTDEEFTQFSEFGHSTWEEGMRICQAAGVQNYCAFHHRPSRSDDALDAIAKELKAQFPGGTVGQEGQVIIL